MTLSRILGLVLLTVLANPCLAVEPSECDLLLAAHLIDPARTYQEDGRYAAMTRYRFLGQILKYRPMVTEIRPVNSLAGEEMILHLDQQPIGRDKFVIKTQLVFAAFEEEIWYDYRTGAVGTGNLAGTVLRPGQVRVRFELNYHPQVTRYELHRLHDEIIPLIQIRLNELNLSAKAKFGHSLLRSIVQQYPGEYDASSAQTMTPEELAFVIEALGPKTRPVKTTPTGESTNSRAI